ncbi:hypothetical protein [Winogradskyella flava]|uniref:hypothetical protein n=1 Tax=Winogradskyella flava TaxID=1884876 RepID=UPI0024912E01|nr:hypothetical protein [Winogradskyella flava]
MKSTKTILVILFYVLFISCEKDDDMSSSSSTVYNEIAFAEIFQVNGVGATPYALTDGVTTATNQISLNQFGNTNLNGFDTRIAVPTDNSVSINASLNSVTIILNNGMEVPPFFAGGEVGGTIDAGDSILRQEFIYNFTYPTNANPINLSTDINRIELIYEFEYLDNESVIHNKIFTHTIFVD